MPLVAEPDLRERTAAPMPAFPPIQSGLVVPKLPPLEPGDHLTREEFERRYHAMPSLKKAELIEGVVYMPSPVRWDKHGVQHFKLIGWFNAYVDETPGVEGADNATVRLDLDNEPQPDVTLIIKPRGGGQVAIDDDGYVAGSPELVAEVAASSVSFDLHTKFLVYRRAGVREYLVWRVLDQEFDWFVLRGSQFERLVPDADGCLKSEVFPGLWLSVPHLIAANFRAVGAVLQLGLQSAEHAAFVTKLEQAAASGK